MKGIRLLAIFAIAAAGLIACASDDVQTLVGTDSGPLNAGAPVYISIPKDPSDPDYAGTGQLIADDVAAELSKRHVQLTIASATATDDENLAAARKAGAAYLFEPVITNWEHNATQWSMNPSTLGLRMSIIAVETGKQMRVDDIQSASSHFSMFGTDPKELLKDAVENYVGKLYP